LGFVPVPSNFFQRERWRSRATTGDALLRGVNWFTALLIVGSAVLLAILLAYLREEERNRNIARLNASAQIIAEQTTRTLQTVDASFALLDIRMAELAARGPFTRETLAELLGEARKSLPFVRTIWALDDSGRLIADEPARGSAGMNFSQREYFQAFVRDSARQTFLGSPQLSGFTNTWFFAAARALRAPNGTLRGVVVAGIEPPYFHRLWDGLDLGEGSVMSLVRRDGTLLMRNPPDEQAMRRNYANTPLFRMYIAGPPNGNYVNASAVDGVTRYYAFRTLDNHPDVALLTGVPLDNLLAQWRRVAAVATAVWAVAALMIALMAALLKREWRRRAESEENLRMRVAQLQSIYNGVPVGLSFVDRNFRYVEVNERLANVNRISPEAHRGKRLREVVPHLADRLEGFYGQAMEEGRPVENVEISSGRADPTGVSRTWLCSFHPARGPDGAITGAMAAILDITEQKRAEELRRELEAQIQQLQKLESIGQLTGGIAHDFNNLLTVILGNAELLATQMTEKDPSRALAEMTLSAAVRGAELTHRLLAFARRQPLDPRTVDLNRLLAGMDGLLRRTVREDIEITVKPGADLWPALVDASQLESAVVNLSINARDAMPRGGRLTVETANVTLDDSYVARHPDASAGDYVMVAVSDTGGGIAPENLPRVFEPFFTTKDAGKGTGLGLSMVYGFVKQSQGHITVESEVGQGTTIRMYLPRSHVAVSEASGAAADTKLDRGRETILLVEDDALVRVYAEKQLAALGYTVIAAADGASALEVIGRRDDIDLLFTDVVMPGGINGKQLADAALKLRPRLKVIFCSGYSEDSIVHDGRLDPGVHLLQKPFRRADLAAKLRTVLTG
jgi:PAS domain S-box-containing protein